MTMSPTASATITGTEEATTGAVPPNNTNNADVIGDDAGPSFLLPNYDTDRSDNEEALPSIPLPPATAATDNNNPSDTTNNNFVAVRRGKGGLRGCIFLEWEDAKAFLLEQEEQQEEQTVRKEGTAAARTGNTSCNTSYEYAVFTNIQDALIYTRAGSTSRGAGAGATATTRSKHGATATTNGEALHALNTAGTTVAGVTMELVGTESGAGAAMAMAGYGSSSSHSCSSRSRKRKHGGGETEDDDDDKDLKEEAAKEDDQSAATKEKEREDADKAKNTTTPSQSTRRSSRTQLQVQVVEPVTTKTIAENKSTKKKLAKKKKKGHTKSITTSSSPKKKRRTLSSSNPPSSRRVVDDDDDDGYESAYSAGSTRRCMKPNTKWMKMYHALEAYLEEHDGKWPRIISSRQLKRKNSSQSQSERDNTTTGEGNQDHPHNGDATTKNGANDDDDNNDNDERTSNASIGNSKHHHGTTANKDHPKQQKHPVVASVDDLVKWMDTQRYHYKLRMEGKRACMNPIKIRMLHDLDFDFQYTSWEDHLEQLKQVKQQFIIQQQEEQQKDQREQQENGNGTATDNKESLEQYLEQILVHPFSNHRYGDNASDNEGNDNDDKSDNEEEDDEDDPGKSPKKINYYELGKWFYKQQEQCSLFLQGKPCAVSKAQMEQLFALQVCDPGKLAQPQPKRLKKSVLIKQEKAEQQRLQKQEEDAKHFEEMFQKLIEYKEEHGNCQVPKTLNNELSKWVISIKNMYRRIKAKDGNSNNHKSNKPSPKGTVLLTPDRFQRLQDLGFVFCSTEKSPYLKFHEWVERLAAFKEEHGHCRVPHDFPEDPSLSAWVHRQRNEYRKFQQEEEHGPDIVHQRPYASKYEAKSTLNAERIQTLTDMGFIWQVAKRTGSFFGADRKSWDERFDDLLEYKRVHGHTLVPQGYPKLGEWVKRQRRSYKFLMEGRKQPNISPEQALRLQEIGFIFDVRKQQWHQRVQEESKQQDEIEQAQQQQQPQPMQQQQQPPLPPLPTLPPFPHNNYRVFDPHMMHPPPHHQQQILHQHEMHLQQQYQQMQIQQQQQQQPQGHLQPQQGNTMQNYQPQHQLGGGHPQQQQQGHLQQTQHHGQQPLEQQQPQQQLLQHQHQQPLAVLDHRPQQQQPQPQAVPEQQHQLPAAHHQQQQQQPEHASHNQQQQLPLVGQPHLQGGQGGQAGQLLQPGHHTVMPLQVGVVIAGVPHTTADTNMTHTTQQEQTNNGSQHQGQRHQQEQQQLAQDGEERQEGYWAM